MEPRFLLLAAMAEEREPFLSAGAQHRPASSPHAEITDIEISGAPGQILLTGIGPVAAATALSAHLATHPRPELIVSVGSAGGLHQTVAVGSVIVGASYRWADVDVRAFGYELGQVPQMPARYVTSVDLEGFEGREHVHVGELLTSSSFVSAELAEPIREKFPHGLAIDMESAALAQTCHLHGIGSFVSIRGISDLCSPRAGEEFHDGLGLAATRSYEVALSLLAGG